MNRLPIRLRLTLVFALAMAVVLFAAGWLVYTRVESSLERAINTQLRSRGQDVSALVRRDGSLESTGGVLVEHGESFAQLLARDGSVLDATAPIGHDRLLTPSEVARARRGPIFLNRRAVPGGDEPTRLLALPVTRGGQQLVLVVGATQETSAETLHSLRDAFLIGGPLALVLASLGGYVLAGAALRPIEAMRRRAADISASIAGRAAARPTDEGRGRAAGRDVERDAEPNRRRRSHASGGSSPTRATSCARRSRCCKTELELALRRARTRKSSRRRSVLAAEETERLAPHRRRPAAAGARRARARPATARGGRRRRCSRLGRSALPATRRARAAGACGRRR